VTGLNKKKKKKKKLQKLPNSDIARTGPLEESVNKKNDLIKDLNPKTKV